VHLLYLEMLVLKKKLKEAKEAKDGKTEVKTVSISSSTPSAKAAVAAPVVPVESYVVNEKCMAYWEKDKKYYAAIIKKVIGTNYVVSYTQYGNSVTLPATQIKKMTAPGKKK